MEHNLTQIEVHCISHLLFNLGLFLKHSLPSYPFIDGPEGVTLKLANPTGVKGERPGTGKLRPGCTTRNFSAPVVGRHVRCLYHI